MNRVREAMEGIYMLEELSEKNTVLTEVHPAVKLLVTIAYLIALLSFPKYNLAGTLSMAAYPVLLFNLGDMPVKAVFRQLRVLLILLMAVGLANLITDRNVLAYWGRLPITGGVFSFATLSLKGIFALCASYLLIASTGMGRICYALQLFRVPRLLITVILLIYRYIILFLKEVDRTTLAYSLRAPKEKGIRRKAWGALAGNLLLRSADRAELIYESMVLRGFTGEFRLKEREKGTAVKSICYGAVMTAGILFLRFVPLFDLLGNWIG